MMLAARLTRSDRPTMPSNSESRLTISESAEARDCTKSFITHSAWGPRDGIRGREFGQEAFDHYFYTKAVMVNKSNEPFDWFEAEMRDLRLN